MGSLRCLNTQTCAFTTGTREEEPTDLPRSGIRVSPRARAIPHLGALFARVPSPGHGTPAAQPRPRGLVGQGEHRVTPRTPASPEGRHCGCQVAVAIRGRTGAPPRNTHPCRPADGSGARAAHAGTGDARAAGMSGAHLPPRRCRRCCCRLLPPASRAAGAGRVYIAAGRSRPAAPAAARARRRTEPGRSAPCGTAPHPAPPPRAGHPAPRESPTAPCPKGTCQGKHEHHDRGDDIDNREFS